MEWSAAIGIGAQGSQCGLQTLLALGMRPQGIVNTCQAIGRKPGPHTADTVIPRAAARLERWQQALVAAGVEPHGAALPANRSTQAVVTCKYSAEPAYRFAQVASLGQYVLALAADPIGEPFAAVTTESSSSIRPRARSRASRARRPASTTRSRGLPTARSSPPARRSGRSSTIRTPPSQGSR